MVLTKELHVDVSCSQKPVKMPYEVSRCLPSSLQKVFTLLTQDNTDRKIANMKQFAWYNIGSQLNDSVRGETFVWIDFLNKAIQNLSSNYKT